MQTLPVVLGGAVRLVEVPAVGDHFAPARRGLVAIVAGEHAAVPPGCFFLSTGILPSPHKCLL